MAILVKGGRLVDAASQLDEKLDILIEDDTVCRIGKDLSPKPQTQVIDATDKVVLPGLVDLHVHLREPGQTYKEDIQSGARAAARGGVTTMVAMPNTTPVIDCPEHLNLIREQLSRAPVHIYQAGALTRGQQGEEPSDIAAMAAAGIRVLSEDGKSVMNPAVLKQAMQQAQAAGLPVFDHCEDIRLRGQGCMHMGEKSKELGLPGISSSVEDTITARDLILARECGLRLHLCHMSTRGAVQLLRFAHQLGWTEMSGEVCPHHFMLTTRDIDRDDGKYKMNPPIREAQDVAEIMRGLADGTIAAISTDHAPHAAAEKQGSMRTAAFGIIGLETSLALSYTGLVKTGVLSLLQLVEKMCLNPARILGVSAGFLSPGGPADLVIADLEHACTIDSSRFYSKARNTPFDGWRVQGRVCQTICGGKLIYDEKTEQILEDDR